MRTAFQRGHLRATSFVTTPQNRSSRTAVARIEEEKHQEQDLWDDLLAGIKGETCPANDATDRDGYEERLSARSASGECELPTFANTWRAESSVRAGRLSFWRPRAKINRLVLRPASSAVSYGPWSVDASKIVLT